jgi:ribosomal protein S18 acetylase RimI-like enzyme
MALGTLPEYQGKGFAKKLVQIAIDLQDRDQRMYYATVRPAAWKLYENLGFEDFADLEIDLAPWGGRVDKTKLMIRHPKSLN